jgi:putative membrane protein
MGFLGTAAGFVSDLILVIEIVITILVILGYVYARQKKVKMHHRIMLYASILNVIFIVAYMLKSIIEGSTEFSGPDSVYRSIYLPVVITHGLVAVIVIVLLIVTVISGFMTMKNKQNQSQSEDNVGESASRSKLHARSGLIYIPLWILTIVTGIIVYLYLYVIYP